MLTHSSPNLFISTSHAGFGPRSFCIRRPTLLLFLCLPLPALADVVYGGMVNLLGFNTISPGVALRGALVFFILFTAFLKFNHLGKGAAILIYLMVFCSVPALFVSAFTSDSFFSDVIHGTKAIFMPLLLGFVAYLINRYRIDESTILRMLEVWTYVMTFGFVIPDALGISVQTYGDYAAGSKGLFVAGNDSALALGLGLLAVSYRLFFLRFSTLRFVMFLLGVFAVVGVGSRTALLLTSASGVVILVAIVFFQGPRMSVSLFEKLWRSISSVILLVSIAYAVSFGIALQTASEYQREKLHDLAEGAHPRGILILSALQYLDDREGWKNFTGEGSHNYGIGVGKFWPAASKKFAEVDYLDAYGAYGAPYLVTSHILMLFIVFIAITNTIYYRSALSFILGGASVAYLFHSLLAGHALFTPTVATVFAVCGALILKEGQLRRMRLKPTQ